MSADLLWEVVGAVAGTASVGFAFWQVLIARAQNRSLGQTETVLPFSSQPPPFGRLPEVRGQDALLSSIEEQIKIDRRVQVISGMGGVGKTTIALKLCQTFAQSGRRKRIWWIPASDETSLTSGMLGIASELGAPASDLTLIEQRNPIAIDKFWELLERAPFKWMLVLDNADTVDLLAKNDTDFRISDGTGWIRKSMKGNLIVTSRIADPIIWGMQCIVHRVDIPATAEAARILLDLAPSGGTAKEASELAERLGNLPLALHLAGEAISSHYSMLQSFRSYLEQLDKLGLGVLTEVSGAGKRPRARRAIMTTWEISMSSLDNSLPVSRFLLRVLSCFAPATPIPVKLLNYQLLVSGLPERLAEAAKADVNVIENSLYGLGQVGLISLNIRSKNDSYIVIHSLVVEVSRSHTASNSDDGWTKYDVYSMAATLVVGLAEGLPGDEPGTWDEWRSIVPHMRSLLKVVDGHSLDVQTSDRLLRGVFCAMQFFWWNGDVKSSNELGELALDQLSESSGDLATLLSVRGAMALTVGYFEGWSRTEQLLRQLVAEGDTAGVSNTPELLRISQELANCIRENGKLAEAESRFRTVYQRRTEVLGPDHRDTLDSMHELGRTIGRSGRFDESLRIFTELVEARLRTLGEDNPRTLAAQHELASSLASVGRISEAIARMSSTFDRRNSILGAKHSATLDSRQELARYVGAEGDLDRAVNELRVTTNLWSETLGAENLRTISCRYYWALALLQAGRLHEARGEMNEVLHMRQRVLGNDHPDTIESRNALNAICAQI